MLSYQHLYHAGNLADVQKHALLCWILEYLTRKEKPLSYFETHAGRGLYDLQASEAQKTGEAAKGVELVLENWFDDEHPYRKVISAVREKHGSSSYAGSPVLAAELLRDSDSISLCELHPQEATALRQAMRGSGANVIKRDGVETAQSWCPPTPRRGMMLIDPSYEVKSDYDLMARTLPALHKKWNVGVIALWYPILTSGLQKPMVEKLKRALPQGLRHEVRFPAVRDGHKMVGSGMFVVNPPFGLEDETKRLSAAFITLRA